VNKGFNLGAVFAAYDGEELNVRNSSGYSELFDVITGTGGSWSKYMSTCTPATPIPTMGTLPALDPECKLAPSKDSYCDRAASQYGGDVVAALDELIADDRKLAAPGCFDSQRAFAAASLQDAHYEEYYARLVETAALVVYLLSFGPATWLYERQVVPDSAVTMIYAPVLSAYVYASRPIRQATDWYMALWSKKSDEGIFYDPVPQVVPIR
jgi:hypothetical protein